MKLTRYYFISDDLDDLEGFERDLERADMVTPQIHLLTHDDAGAADHYGLAEVTSFMKRDIIHSTLVGAAGGACAFVLVLIVCYLAGWTASAAGWMPFVLLAVAVFGFLTWQGGLWGIQRSNAYVKRFRDALAQGRHVFFVDADAGQEDELKSMAERHPTLEPAGRTRGAPRWTVFPRHHIKRFFKETFP